MRILLIDDDPMVLNSIATALDLFEYKCDCYLKPELAVQSYHSNSYDVIITDLNMPKMNGLEVIEQLNLINPHTSVILMSGFCEFTPSISSKFFGLFTFLKKPLSIGELFERLEEINREINKEFAV